MSFFEELLLTQKLSVKLKVIFYLKVDKYIIKSKPPSFIAELLINDEFNKATMNLWDFIVQLEEIVLKSCKEICGKRDFKLLEIKKFKFISLDSNSFASLKK